MHVTNPELGEENEQDNKHKVMLCTEPTLDVSLAYMSPNLQGALYLAICLSPHGYTMNQLSPSFGTEIMTEDKKNQFPL